MIDFKEKLTYNLNNLNGLDFWKRVRLQYLNSVTNNSNITSYCRHSSIFFNSWKRTSFRVALKSTFYIYCMLKEREFIEYSSDEEYLIKYIKDELNVEKIINERIEFINFVIKIYEIY